MAFKTKNENDRFDRSTCTVCGTVFAGVASFDTHRPCDGKKPRKGFSTVNGVVVSHEKADAYSAMVNKARKARSGK